MEQSWHLDLVQRYFINLIQCQNETKNPIKNLSLTLHGTLTMEALKNEKLCQF